MSLLNKFFGIKREVPAAPHTNVSITNDTSDSGFVMVPNVVNSHQLQSGNYSNKTTVPFIMQ
jgi:hypothetical protein